MLGSARMERRVAWRSPATFLGGAFVAGAVLCAQPAHAGEPMWGNWGGVPDAPSKEAEYDYELARSGAIMTGFAIGTLVGGGVTLGIAEHGKEYCGLEGCFRYPDIDARLAGRLMLAGGSAMGLIAVPVWLAGVSSKPWERRSDRRMVTGIVLTTVGTGSCVVSAVMLAALIDPTLVEGDRRDTPNTVAMPEIDKLDTELFIPTIVQALTGVAMVATGIPLWAAGARSPKEEKYPPWMYPTLRVSLGGGSLETRF